MIERRIENRQIVSIFSLFLLGQLLALFLIILGLPYALQLENIIASPTNILSTVVSIILDIVVIALIFSFIFKLYKNNTIFRILEGYIIILGSGSIFFLTIMSFFGIYISLLYSLLIAFILSLLLLYIKTMKKQNPKIRNITTLLSSVGLGILIGVGFGNILLLYILMAVFAVYDYLAVFVMKFMIPMAKQAVNMNLAFMISSSDIEAIPKKDFSKKEISEFNTYVKKNKHYSEHLKEIIKRGSFPTLSSIMLGNGDIMLPVAVATGSYAATYNLFLSTLIVIFSGLGVITTMFILRKYKVGLPAIPPLFSFISFAFAIFFILEDPTQTFFIILFISVAIISMGALLITLRKLIKNQKGLV
ncbi:MAG: presenilin family intramembrane aspartyl protease [Candidatus Micrarchaeaceae archaeon]